jgi:hypothetical protein
MTTVVPVVYVAGPYRGACESEVFSNIVAARAVAAEVWRLKAVAICPHCNTAFMGGVVPDKRFLEGDLELLRRSDAVITVEGWERSVGARNEIAEAKEIDLPVFHQIEHLANWIRRLG